MSTVDSLLSNYQHIITELKIIPGGGGVFDVVVNGENLFSKHEVERHANDGEVLELFSQLVGPDVPRFDD